MAKGIVFCSSVDGLGDVAKGVAFYFSLDGWGAGRRGAITGLSKDVIIEITGGGILLKSIFQKLMK